MTRTPKPAPPAPPPADPIAQQLAEEITLAEAVTISGLHPNTLRMAIREGRLPARLPMGRDARHTGAVGYRIKRTDLATFLFGAPPAKE